MVQDYLLEFLTEGRFEFTKPEGFKYNGIKQVGVGMVGDSAMARDTSSITFTTDGTSYDLTLLTSITYEPVLTETGEIQFHVKNDYIYPVFIDEQGKETELTNSVMSSDIGKEVIQGLADQPALVSVNREFDVSEGDPSKSDEKFATTGKGKPIPKINMTYFLLRKVFLDKFKSMHLTKLHPQIFKPEFSEFYNNIKYELESITFVAKPDFKGDTRRANLYNRWWKAMGSEMGTISGIDTENTSDGIAFEVMFNNTNLGD